jgi:metal-dependent amidase/aminoacylase/carboxypeptidase family protein
MALAAAQVHAMLKGPLDHELPMNAIHGLHDWPRLRSLALSSGSVMTSSNVASNVGCYAFEIVIHGKGAHAASP